MIKIFETFAGIGAQHKAATKLNKKYPASFKVSGVSEWDVYANISYAAIHHNKEFKKELKKLNNNIPCFEDLKAMTWSRNGKTPINENQFNRMELETKLQLFAAVKVNNSIGSVVDLTGEMIDKSVGQVDLLTYSFPCQDLSPAGSIHGFNKGMAKGSSTRSGLLWEIERILNDLSKLNKKPKYLLLENVRNMLSKQHKGSYELWIETLMNLGYSTKTYILKSSDYGIPQTRVRVYGLSILNYDGITKDGMIMDINDPEKLKMKPLEKFLKTDYTVDKYRFEALKAQPNKTPSRKRMFNENPKLLNPSRKTVRTITTKQDRHPNAGVIDLEGTLIGCDNRVEKVPGTPRANYRFLTPREEFTLMGFTEKDYENILDYNIRLEKQYQQAGNSIVVDTIEQIFKEIMKYENKH